MKVRPCIFCQSTNFHEAKSLPRNFRDALSLPERTSSVSLGVKGPLRSWRTDFLFDYEIFPKTILRFDAEWLREDRGMAVGDVIVQRAVFPPIGFGLCIEFAVRICRVIDEELRLGFAYETLCGHVERGVAEFYFEEREESVEFTIHTYSEPGHWTSRLLKNIFSEPYQAWCTQRALIQVRRRFESENFREPQGKEPL